MINPIKMYYVTTKDETTIIYEEPDFRKKIPQERTFTFKGRFKKRPTIYNITKFLKDRRN